MTVFVVQDKNYQVLRVTKTMEEGKAVKNAALIWAYDTEEGLPLFGQYIETVTKWFPDCLGE